MADPEWLEVRDGKRGVWACPQCGRRMGEQHTITCPSHGTRRGAPPAEVRADTGARWYELVEPKVVAESRA